MVGVAEVYDTYRRLKIIANDSNQPDALRAQARALLLRMGNTHPQWWEEFDQHSDTAKANSINIKIYIGLGILAAGLMFLFVWKIILKK